jgi:SAM-dependent methyltransferase
MGVNRNTIRRSARLKSAIVSLLRLTLSLSLRKITFRQFCLEIEMRLENQSTWQGDDFNWAKYNKYYLEELKSISRVHTLIIESNEFRLSGGRIRKLNLRTANLHPNHKLLYETILGTPVIEVLEIGCGGGDHLANLKTLKNDLDLFGVDRSAAQLETFRSRHPELHTKLEIVDITNPRVELPSVELVYSQAVLMHISESEDRFSHALTNIFKSATKYVVLMENWAQHDFLSAVTKVMQESSSWKEGKLYFKSSDENSKVRLMIASIHPLQESPLSNYEDLLQGQPLISH